MRVAILILLSSAVALADPDPEAQRLLDEGTRLFTEDAKYEEARDAFQKSYDKEPSWRALNGIALTFKEQGRLVEAIDTYDKLIRDFDAVLSDAQRTTVKARIAELETKIGVLAVIATQAGVAITIDSADLGTGPIEKLVRVLPGRHVVVATKQGFRTLSRPVTVDAGQKLPVEIELEAETERIVVREQPARLERRFRKRTPYAVIGAGAGLTLVGGIFHVLARNSYAKFDDSVAKASGTPPMAVAGDTKLRDRGDLQMGIAIGGYALGVAAMITGGVLAAINQPRPVKESARRVDLVPAKRGVTLVVRF